MPKRRITGTHVLIAIVLIIILSSQTTLFTVFQDGQRAPTVNPGDSVYSKVCAFPEGGNFEPKEGILPLWSLDLTYSHGTSSTTIGLDFDSWGCKEIPWVIPDDFEAGQYTEELIMTAGKNITSASWDYFVYNSFIDSNAFTVVIVAPEPEPGPVVTCGEMEILKNGMCIPCGTETARVEDNVCIAADFPPPSSGSVDESEKGSVPIISPSTDNNTVPTQIIDLPEPVVQTVTVWNIVDGECVSREVTQDTVAYGSEEQCENALENQQILLFGGGSVALLLVILIVAFFVFRKSRGRK